MQASEIDTKTKQKLAMTPEQEKETYKQRMKGQARANFTTMKRALAARNGRLREPSQTVWSKSKPKTHLPAEDSDKQESDQEMEERVNKEFDVTLAKINGDDSKFDVSDYNNLSHIIVGLVRVYVNRFWKEKMPSGEQVMETLQTAFHHQEKVEMFEFMTEVGWLLIAHAYYWRVFDEHGNLDQWFQGTKTATELDDKCLLAFLRMGAMRPVLDPEHTNHKYLEAVDRFVELPKDLPEISTSSSPLPDAQDVVAGPLPLSEREIKKKQRKAAQKKRQKLLKKMAIKYTPLSAEQEGELQARKKAYRKFLEPFYETKTL